MVSLVFVFFAMAEFAFVLFVNRNRKWKNTKQLDVSNGTSFNRVVIDTSNDAANAASNVGPEITNVVNLAEPRDREIGQMGFWRKKYVHFYGLSFPTKIDCAAFLFYYLGYLIFNCVYIVWATKTFYENN